MVCAKFDVILAAMAASCKTPKQIADAAGVSVNSVYRVRQGYMVKIEILGKICKALDIDCMEVIDFQRTKEFNKTRRR